MIVTNNLDEYVVLKGLINHCTHTLETTRNCSNCEMNKICSVALNSSTLMNLDVKYFPVGSIALEDALTRALEKANTLAERKKDGEKVELTF